MKQKNLFILSMIFCIGISLNANAGQGILFYKAGFPQVAKPLLIAELENEPNTKSETSFYLGNIYFGENKPDSAEIYFKIGLAANPSFAQNSIGLIMLKIKKTDPKIIDKELKKIVSLKQNKKNINVYIAIAYAYLYNDMPEKAMAYQAKAKGIKSKNPLVYVLLGDIVVRNSLGDACSNYESAILYDENCKEAYVKYARVYKSVNPKLSIDKLMTLKQKDPSFTLVDKELGDVYYNTNDFEKAAKYYEVYLQSGNSDIQDLTKYSMTLFLNHDFDKSLEVANLGLTKAPRNPAFNRLAMFNNVDLKRPEAALKAADLFFNQTDKANFTYLDYRYYGQALKDNKQITLATEQFEKALSLDSSKVELWKDISDMYSENGNYTKSVEAFNKYYNSLSDKARDNDVVMTFGKLYYSLGNDTTVTADVRKKALLNADSLFSKIADLEPEGYRANFWRARANSALDPETTLGLAKPYYDKTIALVEPKNDARYNSVLVECYSYLGYYTLLQKDNATSINYWNKILKINPNNTTAKKAIEGISAPTKKGKK